MINNDRETIIFEELLMVRHSGEIPEVALHGSLYYLCEDAEGPRFILADEELQPLQSAALERYQEIILRDLDVANRDRPLFRGVRRAIHNWYRFARFSEKIGCPFEAFRAIAAKALMTYLHQELNDVRSGKRVSSLNCTTEALITFAYALGIDPKLQSSAWDGLCEKSG